MLSYQKGVVKTSVRHLVEFLFRGGDITTGSSVSASPEAMLEGSRLHRKIQRGQKATYQSEVPLKMEWQEERYDLVLEGRADGIDKTEVNKDRLSDVDGMNQIESNEEKLTYVDEIKCVSRCGRDRGSRHFTFGTGKVLCVHVWSEAGFREDRGTNYILSFRN